MELICDLFGSDVYFFFYTCLEYSFDNLSNKLVMYTFFFKKERFTFHVHNNLSGIFGKRVGGDFVPLIWSGVYDLIYHTKLYTVFTGQSPQFHLIFY